MFVLINFPKIDGRDIGSDRRLKSHGSLVSKSGHFFDIVSRSIF